MRPDAIVGIGLEAIWRSLAAEIATMGDNLDEASARAGAGILVTFGADGG